MLHINIKKDKQLQEIRRIGHLLQGDSIADPNRNHLIDHCKHYNLHCKKIKPTTSEVTTTL